MSTLFHQPFWIPGPFLTFKTPPFCTAVLRARCGFQRFAHGENPTGRWGIMKRNTRLASWELLTLVSHVFLGVEMSMWLPDLGKIAECNVHTMMSAILAKPLLLDHKTIGLGSGFARSQTKMVRLANAFWGPYVSLAQVDIDKIYKMYKKWSRWLPKSAFLFYMPQPIDNHLEVKPWAKISHASAVLQACQVRELTRLTALGHLSGSPNHNFTLHCRVEVG
jgi:hypothetical protein